MNHIGKHSAAQKLFQIAVTALLALVVVASGWGDVLFEPRESVAEHHLVSNGDYSRVQQLEDSLIDQLAIDFRENGNSESFLLSFESDIATRYNDGDLEEYEFEYLSALVNQELYTIYQHVRRPRDTEKALEHQELAFEHSKKAIAFDEGYANIYALHADILVSIFDTGGPGKWFQHNREREANAKRALKLEKNNALVLQSDALFKLNAPGIAGGNVKKAITAFESLLEHGNEVQQQRGHTWLSVAHFKNGDTNEALAIIDEHIQEYPKNEFLKRYQRLYKAGENPLTSEE